ncbi:hypothetical protein I4U23_011174 [Adineta vaga]|nr:hypothetical protein I4U23_011174 [Adineta vaga]
MDFTSIINRLYIIFSSWDFCVAFAFLTLALIYRHRCFNYPTLLACNTAFAVLFNSANHFSIGIYMLIWDQYENPKIDSLCSLRAYFHHSSIASIHHSFILLALERFCKIRNLTLLKNRYRKISMVLIQWLFDFTFPLPVFITGNMPKVQSENACFVILTRPDLVLVLAGTAFLLTDISLSIIYRLLIRHMRQISSRLNNNQQMKMQRDLTVVRRIVLLNSQLAVAGIPVLIHITLILIRSDLLPPRTTRIIFFMASLPLSPMLIILLYFTPDLRQSCIECGKKLKFGRLTRIAPAQVTSLNRPK